VKAIRVLIVDDEPLARRGVRQLLACHDGFEVVSECRDGAEALRALAAHRPDLVFLDVEMPGLGGLDVVRRHGPERMPLTVFVTAHDEFAVEAFEAAAVDYLVKPLVEARFAAAIARVRERIRMHDAVALARELSSLLEGQGQSAGAAPTGGASRRTIPIPTPTGELLLDSERIEWVTAEDDGVVIHEGGRSHRIRMPLAALEDALDPSRFARIHRSAIVRLDRVREWRDAPSEREATVILTDGTRLPVSRRRLAAVKALLRSAGRER